MGQSSSLPESLRAGKRKSYPPKLKTFTLNSHTNLNTTHKKKKRVLRFIPRNLRLAAVVSLFISKLYIYINNLLRVRIDRSDSSRSSHYTVYRSWIRKIRVDVCAICRPQTGRKSQLYQFADPLFHCSFTA